MRRFEKASSDSIRATHCIVITEKCCVGFVQWSVSTETQVKRLSTFHDRSRRIVIGDSGTCDEIQSVVNANKIRACKLVRKCIDKDICDAIQGYFNINDHTVRTRNHQSLLKIPKIKTEFARKSFRFMGATIYNELPIQVRRIKSFIAYEQSLKQNFA